MWPLCDCLIAFHSKGFPLEKSISYAQLRRPYIINNLEGPKEDRLSHNAEDVSVCLHPLPVRLVNFPNPIEVCLLSHDDRPATPGSPVISDNEEDDRMLAQL